MPDPRNRPAAGRPANDDTRKKPETESDDEEKLEKGLEDTFPASDPVSVTAPGSKDRPTKVDPVREAREDRNGQLDEGLLDTFPASDPVSVISSTRAGRPERKR